MSDRFRFANRAWRDRLRAAGLGSLTALLAAPSTGPPEAESRTSRTDIVLAGTTTVHRKVYRVTGALRRLAASWPGRARAAREWRALRALRASGLPAVEPVAIGIRRRAGIVVRTVLVTATATGAKRLDRWLAATPGETERRGALANVAHVVARAHDDGHVLGAPALRDVLVGPDGVHLVDLAGHRRRGRVGVSAAVADLALVAAGLAALVPPCACRRALAEYRTARRTSRPLRRGLTALVDDAARPHLAREAHRVRE